MPRFIKTFIAALLVLCATVPIASAKVIEMGAIDEAGPAPSCPGEPCTALARITGFQKRLAGKANVYTVRQPGRLVAWSVRLSEPNDVQIDFFEGRTGNEGPEANITVFRASKKKGERGMFRSVAESGVQDLEGFYGQIVQFPMINPIRVRKGDRIALTTETWAPVLALNLEDNYKWRATRPETDCLDKDRAFDPNAISTIGTLTAFTCAYSNVQLLYSATLITAPVPNKTDDTEEKPATPR